MKRADGKLSIVQSDPRTLAVDIGGTGLKASVLDRAGRMLGEHVRVATPYPCHPETLVGAIADLVTPLLPFDRISMGFPGVIRDGKVVTAPHFGTKEWRDYPLADSISNRFGKPARLLNDAEVQGLGVVCGRGLEVVLTLGTGVGSAVFKDGRLAPHIELAHHPIHNGETYNDYIGSKARDAQSVKKWSRRVLRVIEIVYDLLHYDTLYLGGGNAAHLEIDLPANVKITSNDAGMTGGIRLWDEDFWRLESDSHASGTIAPPSGPATSSPSAAGSK